jgi:hypothetical protein
MRATGVSGPLVAVNVDLAAAEGPLEQEGPQQAGSYKAEKGVNAGSVPPR